MFNYFVKRLKLSLSFFIFISLILNVQCNYFSQEDKPVRVLFIGNSYTYFNNLPAILEGLANENGVNLVLAEMITKSGATLEEHWHDGVALTRIKEESWDYVILQEMSHLDTRSIINGRFVIGDPEKFHKYVRLFDSEIKKNNARTVLLHTWAVEFWPEEQLALDKAYLSIAHEIKACLIPAGLVWQNTIENYPEIKLYEDGWHPSPSGSYFVACMIYSQFFDKSPIGLPYRITGHPTSKNDGRVLSDSIAVLVDLDAQESRILQEIAWETYHSLKNKGVATLYESLMDSTINTIKISGNLQANNFEGEWHGPLLLKPAEPMTLTLKLENINNYLTLSGYTNSSEWPDAAPLKISGFYIKNNHISFNTIDHINRETRFKGVLIDSLLVGIADLKYHPDPERPNRSVRHMSGIWKLSRKNN